MSRIFWIPFSETMIGPVRSVRRAARLVPHDISESFEEVVGPSHRSSCVPPFDAARAFGNGCGGRGGDLEHDCAHPAVCGCCRARGRSRGLWSVQLQILEFLCYSAADCYPTDLSLVVRWKFARVCASARAILTYLAAGGLSSTDWAVWPGPIP